MASELQVNTITEATSGSGITFAKDVIPATPLSHRNMIINGAMQVNQRGTADATNSNGYPVDRFRGRVNAMDNLVIGLSQENDAPAGFTKSVKLNVNTAEGALASDEYFRFEQTIEAQNLQHLNYATSDAESLTLSFWVKSNLTGTYAFDLFKPDTTLRNITRTYTINAQNTWEKKTLTFPGDTDSGATIANDNGAGLQLQWILAAGSQWTTTDSTSWGNWANGRLAYGHTANWSTTQNNNWYITGVQLELGTVATPFENKSYGEELQRCQRYYWRMPTNGYVFAIIDGNGTYVAPQFHHPVRMRAAPTAGLLHKGSLYINPSGSGQTNVVPNGSTVGYGGNEWGGLANVSGSGNLGGTANDQVVGQWFCGWQFTAEL